MTGGGPPPGEFALIARYFSRPVAERQGAGDDCALIDVGGQTLALTKDLLVEGVHFLPGADPETLGHKSLAVNLSDLAAAGARPRCFLLGLSLPRASAPWLEAFSRGLYGIAQAHGCALVGGDTTRSAPLAGGGPHTISITAIGEVDPARYAGRGGARAGDDLWVSGRVGEARLALEARRGHVALSARWRPGCEARMDRPVPRVALGLALRGIASACIDLSDGLCGDLQHVLERSGVGATLDYAAIPGPEAFEVAPGDFDVALRQTCVLAGGDDYELLFAAPRERRAAVEALDAGVALARIGRIDAQAGLRVLDGGTPLPATTLRGFDHFSD